MRIMEPVGIICTNCLPLGLKHLAMQNMSTSIINSYRALVCN